MIANGQYRLQFAQSSNDLGVTAAQGAPDLVLSPEQGDGAKWTVTFDGTDSYTLRNVATGLYLGSDSDVSRMAPLLRGAAAPFPWRIERSVNGPEGTFTLSPRDSKGQMWLAPSIVMAFPPPVAWQPAHLGPHFWRLVKV